MPAHAVARPGDRDGKLPASGAAQKIPQLALGRGWVCGYGPDFGHVGAVQTIGVVHIADRQIVGSRPVIAPCLDQEISRRAKEDPNRSSQHQNHAYPAADSLTPHHGLLEDRFWLAWR